MESDRALMVRNPYHHQRRSDSVPEPETDVVVAKRRAEYERRLQADQYDYDTWFDYLRLEVTLLFLYGCCVLTTTSQIEAGASQDRIRDVFERAIAAVPLSSEKAFWQRYIYIWIKYLVHEELVNKDLERCRALYKTCLDLIPHKVFTFAKIWRMFGTSFSSRDFGAADKVSDFGAQLSLSFVAVIWRQPDVFMAVRSGRFHGNDCSSHTSNSSFSWAPSIAAASFTSASLSSCPPHARPGPVLPNSKHPWERKNGR